MVNDQAFIEAIAAEPDNDAARLVYAAWLEEQGNEPAAVTPAIQAYVDHYRKQQRQG